MEAIPEGLRFTFLILFLLYPIFKEVDQPKSVLRIPLNHCTLTANSIPVFRASPLLMVKFVKPSEGSNGVEVNKSVEYLRYQSNVPERQLSHNAKSTPIFIVEVFSQRS